MKLNFFRIYSQIIDMFRVVTKFKKNYFHIVKQYYCSVNKNLTVSQEKRRHQYCYDKALKAHYTVMAGGGTIGGFIGLAGGPFGGIFGAGLGAAIAIPPGIIVSLFTYRFEKSKYKHQ